MKFLNVCFVVLAAGIASCQHVQRREHLPLEKGSAIRLGEQAIARKFGLMRMEEQRPYQAALQRNVWVVFGSMPPPPFPGAVFPGGVSEARISKLTGRVLSVTDEE